MSLIKIYVHSWSLRAKALGTRTTSCWTSTPLKSSETKVSLPLMTAPSTSTLRMITATMVRITPLLFLLFMVIFTVRLCVGFTLVKLCVPLRVWTDSGHSAGSQEGACICWWGDHRSRVWSAARPNLFLRRAGWPELWWRLHAPRKRLCWGCKKLRVVV